MDRQIAELDGVLESSEFLAAVKHIRERKTTARPISSDLIKILESNRCWASDWSRVRVAEGFHPYHVFDAKFFGEVELGSFDLEGIEVEPGVRLSSGVYNSVIIDSVIGDNALVYNVGILSNYVVCTNAAVANTKSVICAGPSAFGNGTRMTIAIETGGREVDSFAELTVPVAGVVARNRENAELQQEYAAFIEKYQAGAESPRGIIDESARVINSGKIANAYVGPYAVIDNVTKLSHSTVLSSREDATSIMDGAWVKGSIIQWGADVASMAIVDSSVICEHARIGRHGRVTQSIIGPNTVIAGGEVTASLCGPFVDSHYQSLLIAALWPEGRGNVGYGANVGSNHTSKAPDQEIWPGEGMFFGLGVNIKFPSDFSRAPYSIIATAVNALPQKVDFPFSLINTPAERYDGISPAYNEISPGWVLSDLIYVVKRNEKKYREQNKAKRSGFDFEVFRPEIIDLMIGARQRLRGVKEVKKIYSDRDIIGLGKNYLTEKSRLAGIEAYTFHIKHYALAGLSRQVDKILMQDSAFSVQEVLTKSSDDQRWNHERDVLSQEFPDQDVKGLLRLLAKSQEKIARDVQVSKEKDDTRGARIIRDYQHAHAPASSDSFVKASWDEARAVAAQIDALLAKM